MADLSALWLFGSFARDEATPISDVDLAYLPDETLTGDGLQQFDTQLYGTIASALKSDDLAALREKAGTPRELYGRSRDIQAIVERRLQTAIERCINIGNHLIARLGLRPPVEYADVFRALAEGGILPGELAQQMMDMARFLNLLVHVYWAIDTERVYDGLSGRLTALETFSRHIAHWLKEYGAGRQGEKVFTAPLAF